ncbi:hypothetical protein GCM10008083_05180 [Ulvibacter litoralis]|nr:hypothetical protein GCM10008083_05180 [Ulvibacter litoralis]
MDLLKIGYGQTFSNNFENTNSSTHVSFSEADVTVPVVLSENNAFITGIGFSQTRLQLFPEAENKNLYSTTLKIGLATTYNDTWSSTVVLLPKIASDYAAVSGDDFYMGGFGVVKFQKTKNLKYRFGVYATMEAFGLFTTPIIGWYYLSENKKFEMDVSLPISVDASYALGKTSVGFDYYGIGRSFAFTENNTSLYVDQSSLEFSGYVQYAMLQKSILIRGKIGYATSNNEVYAKDDTIDLGVSAFSFGDNRILLNPDLNGGAFLKLEAVYRFNLPAKQLENKP